MGRGRTFATAMALVATGATLGLLACLRLAATLADTPSSLWLVEYSPLALAAVSVNERTRERAEQLATTISDPALVTARLAGCRTSPWGGTEAIRSQVVRDAGVECAAVVNDGLLALPVSGELWLKRAMLAAETGEPDDHLFEALRKSFQTAPREGWIAGSRLVIGLRLYSALPEDLKALVTSDLRLVLSDQGLMAPLVDAVVTDEELRRTTLAALASLPVEGQYAFVTAVRAKLSESISSPEDRQN